MSTSERQESVQRLQEAGAISSSQERLLAEQEKERLESQSLEKKTLELQELKSRSSGVATMDLPSVEAIKEPLSRERSFVIREGKIFERKTSESFPSKSKVKFEEKTSFLGERLRETKDVLLFVPRTGLEAVQTLKLGERAKKIREADIGTKLFEKQVGKLTPEARKRAQELTVKESEFLKSTVTEAVEYPFRKPVQFTALALLPGTFKVGETALKLGTGKVLVAGAKAGVVGAKTIKVAQTAGTVTVTGAKVGLGATYAYTRGKEIITAPTEEARGKAFGKTAVELGVISVASASGFKGGRIQEIYEAKVSGPLNVATSKYSTPENIKFAEKVGDIGLKLSSRKITIEPKRGVPFGKIKGATKSDVQTLKTFFKEGGVVKGSTAQSTFLNRELSKQFIQTRGSSFADLDAAVFDRKVPKVGIKTDIKTYTKSKSVIGARPPQKTRGVLVQSFKEQSFRKAVGGFEKDTLFKQKVPRTGKDVRDLLFNVKQAQAEGVKGLGRPVKYVESALAGEKGVTLPLQFVKETPNILPKAESKFVILGRATTSEVSRPRIPARPSRIPIAKQPSRIPISRSPSQIISSRPSKPSVPSSIRVPISDIQPVSSSVPFTPSRPRIPSGPRRPPSAPPSTPSIPKIVPPSLPPTPPSVPPSLPPSRPPLITSRTTTPPKLRFKRFTKPKRIKLKQKPIFRKSRFTPSLVATAYKIRSPKTRKTLEKETLTGIGIRPIPLRI